jgi:hypothetical protein
LNGRALLARDLQEIARLIERVDRPIDHLVCQTGQRKRLVDDLVEVTVPFGNFLEHVEHLPPLKAFDHPPNLRRGIARPPDVRIRHPTHDLAESHVRAVDIALVNEPVE